MGSWGPRRCVNEEPKNESWLMALGFDRKEMVALRAVLQESCVEACLGADRGRRGGRSRRYRRLWASSAVEEKSESVRTARPGCAEKQAGRAHGGAQSRARLAAGSELLRLLSPFFFFFFLKSLSSQV